MIENLKKRIFTILYASISLLIILIVIIVSSVNYSSELSSAVRLMNTAEQADQAIAMMDQMKDKLPPEAVPEEPAKDSSEETMDYTLYTIKIKDGQVTENPEDASDAILSAAEKACRKSSESGLVGNYIYRLKQEGQNIYTVVIMDDAYAVTHIHRIFLLAAGLILLTLIAAFLLSGKLSAIIVEPVRESFERQKQFIQDASHELKTPLSIITINAEMAESRLGENKYLSYIQEESVNMDKLINEMLLLARTENSPKTEGAEEFDLSRKVEAAAKEFATPAEEKKVVMETEIPEGLRFHGKSEDIHHILSVLTDNAIKHANPGSNVKITLSASGNERRIHVINQGEEIPEAEREKIFERFYRIDKSRNRNEKRYGLGLSIARSMAEKYQGTITVSCKNGLTDFQAVIFDKENKSPGK